MNLPGCKGEDRPRSTNPFTACSSKLKQTRFHDANGPGVVEMRRVAHGKMIRPERVEAAAGEFDSRDDSGRFGDRRMAQRWPWLGQRRKQGSRESPILNGIARAPGRGLSQGCFEASLSRDKLVSVWSAPTNN